MGQDTGWEKAGAREQGKAGLVHRSEEHRAVDSGTSGPLEQEAACVGRPAAVHAHPRAVEGEQRSYIEGPGLDSEMRGPGLSCRPSLIHENIKKQKCIL